MTSYTASNAPGKGHADSRVNFARAYIEFGVSVILLHGIRDNGSCTCGKVSCGSPGKHPAGGNWKQAQTQRATPQEIEVALNAGGSFNIGCVTGAISDVVVFDVDGDTPENAALLARLDSFGGPVVKTGRGRHYYFKHPGGHVKNGAGLLPKLDVRGDGGYVVAPPSRHANGSDYKWIDDRGGFPEIPDNVLLFLKERGFWTPEGESTTDTAPLLVAANDPGDASPSQEQTSAYANAALADEIARVANAPEGARNETFNKAAFALGTLVGPCDLNRSEVEARLREAGKAAGLPENEIEATLRSGLVAGEKKPRDLTLALAPESKIGSTASPTPAPFRPLDITVLSRNAKAAPLFPMEVLGPLGQTLAKFATQNSLPIDFPAMALLSGIGAILAATRIVRVASDWKEPPLLWCAAIGEPSSGKTPGLGCITRRLGEIEKEMRKFHDYDRKLAKWKDQRKIAELYEQKWLKSADEALANGKKIPERPLEACTPPMPQLWRCLASDVTTEALGDLIARSKGSLLLCRDELSGWLGAMDRYAGGKGSDRAFYLEAFNGAEYRIDRKTAATASFIERLCVGLLGSIQPDRLADLLEGMDDGLFARFLVAWPDPAPLPQGRIPREGLEFESLTPALLLLAKLKTAEESNKGDDEAEKAEGKWPTPIPVTLCDGALDVLHELRLWVRAEESKRTGIVKSHFGKYPGLAARLACVLTYLRWAGGSAGGEAPTTIGPEAMRDAVNLLKDYFAPMAERVYGDAARSDAERDAQLIARWIVREQNGALSLNARMLTQHRVIPGRDTKRRDEALVVLIEAGVLREAHRLPAVRGKGRPALDYGINPALWNALGNDEAKKAPG